MASISKITLIGNLGRDPETRYTPSGKLNVQFTMAVNHKFRDQGGNLQDRTNWFRVTAWDTLAERLVKFTEQGWLAKGKLIYVEGRFEAREYQDRDGQTRTSLDVTANDVQFVGSRQEPGEGGESGFGRSGGFSGQSGGYQRGGQREAEGGEFGGPDDIDEVPF